MKPKTDPQTGVTSPVMENKDRKVLADAKDRLLLYYQWEGNDELRIAANYAIGGIGTLLTAHPDGEKGESEDHVDSNETESKKDDGKQAKK